MENSCTVICKQIILCKEGSIYRVRGIDTEDGSGLYAVEERLFVNFIPSAIVMETWQVVSEETCPVYDEIIELFKSSA